MKKIKYLAITILMITVVTLLILSTKSKATTGKISSEALEPFLNVNEHFAIDVKEVNKEQKNE